MTHSQPSLTPPHTHVPRCVYHIAWDVNEMQMDGWTRVFWRINDGLLPHLPLASFCCDSVIPQTGSSSVSLPHSIIPLLCIYLLSSPPSLLRSSSSSHCAVTSPFPFHTQAASSTSPLLPFMLTSLRSSHLLLPLRPTLFILLLPFPHHHKLHLPFRSFFPSFLHTRSRCLVQTHAALHTHSC